MIKVFIRHCFCFRCWRIVLCCIGRWRYY